MNSFVITIEVNKLEVNWIYDINYKKTCKSFINIYEKYNELKWHHSKIKISKK